LTPEPYYWYLDQVSAFNFLTTKYWLVNWQRKQNLFWDSIIQLRIRVEFNQFLFSN
jgi:hypothetical protein